MFIGLFGVFGCTLCSCVWCNLVMLLLLLLLWLVCVVLLLLLIMLVFAARWLFCAYVGLCVDWCLCCFSCSLWLFGAVCELLVLLLFIVVFGLTFVCLIIWVLKCGNVVAVCVSVGLVLVRCLLFYVVMIVYVFILHFVACSDCWFCLVSLFGCTLYCLLLFALCV